ncbi:MAG: hypothetical protein Q4A16_07015 [Lautropia sp.]|nr:hypothetical protein [Lautropia sp.]
MRTNENKISPNWNRHVGLTYTAPETREDGIDFSAVSADGQYYHFHLELNALKALDAEAFYDDDAIQRFHAHQRDIERVAGRMVMLNVRANPIVLKASYFAESPWRRLASRQI